MGEGAKIPPLERSQLTFGGELRAQLVVWSRRAMPEEACGLLVGSSGAGRVGPGCAAHVVRATLARNLAGSRSTERFVLDPAHWVVVEKEAASQGLQVLGVWHSHPTGRASDAGAAPSMRDAEGAIPGWSYLILSIDPLDGARWRSWRRPAGARAEMVEERLL